MDSPSPRQKLHPFWDSPLWDYVGYAVLFAFFIFRWESLYWALVCVALAVLLIIRSWTRRRR